PQRHRYRHRHGPLASLLPAAWGAVGMPCPGTSPQPQDCSGRPRTMNSPPARSPRQLRLMEVLEPSGGGSGRHFIDLCRGMQARGHVVHAVYSPVRAEARFVDELTSLGLAGVHTVAMARRPGLSDFASWWALCHAMRRAGPLDIIHGHSSKAGALARIRLPGRHVPRVYTPHALRTMDPDLGAVGRSIYGSIEKLLARTFTDQIGRASCRDSAQTPVGARTATA